MISSAINATNIDSKKGAGRRRNQRAAKKNLLTTGWQLEAENTSEWGVHEPKKTEHTIRTVSTEKENGYINEDYIHTLSTEERQLYEWKKTQRNLGAPVKIFTNLSDLYPKQESSKKLKTPKPVSDNVLRSSITECAPEFSDDAIPDTGMRGKLDLTCMEDKCFLMALADDIKGLSSTQFSSCQQKEQKHADTFNIRNFFNNFTVSLSDGLVPTLLATGDQKFNRVLCATKLNLEEAKEGLKKSYQSFKQIQKLNSMDVAKFIKMESKNDVRKQAHLKCSNFFEVVFANTADGQHFCEVIGKNEEFFTIVMKYPGELDKVEVNYFYSMKAHWYHDFSNKKAKIWIKNPEDVGHAEEVLSRHFMDIEVVDKFRTGGTRMLDAFLRGICEEYTSNQALAEHVIRGLLEANGIEFDRVFLGKCNWRHLSDVDIRQKFNDKVQETIEGLNIAVDNSKQNWTLEISQPKLIPGSVLTEREAIVTFSNSKVGRQYTEQYQSFPRSWLNLATKDDRGVRFSPLYTVELIVPKPFRKACHKSLEKLDEELRKTASIRVKDNFDEEMILIEGWPKARVTEVLRHVKEILKAKEMNCKDDGSPQSPSNLLHGCGLNLVNKLQRDSEGDLLISVDRLNETISFWGDKKKTEDAISALKKYLQEPKKHLLQTEIRIREPRFLPLFKEVLAFNGERAVSDAVGGASIKFMKPDRLLFEGNVEQYEALQELLDEEHRNMVDQATNSISLEEHAALIQECPACLMPPRGGFTLSLCGHVYCLSCLTQMIRVALEAKRSPIQCCSDGCDKLVALRDIMVFTYKCFTLNHIIWGLLLDETIRPYEKLFSDRLQPLWKATVGKVVQQCEDLMFCPQPDCQGVLNKTEKTSRNTVQCCDCKGQLCADCFCTYHPRLSCEDNREIRENEGDSLGDYINKANARRCPNQKCNALIEKDQGCDHMWCSQCHVHFCWHCPCATGKTAQEVNDHLLKVHGRLSQEFAHLDDNEEGNNVGARRFVRRP